MTDTNLPRVSDTLILGTMYLADQQALWLARHWARITRRLNPDAYIAIVESQSELSGRDFPVDTHMVIENIGHMSKNGRDGWGRALTEGIRLALFETMTWLAVIECDLLFARPVASVFDKMAFFRPSIPAVMPVARPHEFIETGLMFLYVPYLKEIDFIGQYDWEHTNEVPERKIERILEPFSLPLRGLRNDHHLLTAANMAQTFPVGIDYLTHCRDAGVYRRFMELNGLGEE